MARRPASRTTPRRPRDGKGGAAANRARRGRAPSRRRPLRRLLKWGFVAAVWGALAVGALVAYYAYGLPPLADIPALERRPAVTLLAADGTPFARFGETTARPVTVAELPPHVPRAVVAVEDARFYSHFGLDLIGLARAVLVNLREGRIVQGGSTITQQLAKNLFLGPERTLERKVQEMVLAFWLERRFTKDEILALYLNRVYFGAGNFGIEAAARSYFDKPAHALQLNEAAMLAGLLRAPSRYSPVRHRDRAAQRARVVLDRMADAGFITEAEARIVKLNPARLRRQTTRLGRYFADWALDQARGYVGQAEGDLVVRTTLDSRLQLIAERETGAMLAGPGQKRGVAQGALIVMAPDGAVRAMVGGADYGDSQFNRATQALRQPGSAFKPIVYLAGLEAGLEPDSELLDAPIRIGDFAPRNYDGRYRGRVTMTQALAHSLNSAAVRVLEHAGVDRVIRWARRLGITSPLRREAGLALGASEVTLIELVSAYAALANGGEGVFAHGVTEIRDGSGRLLYERSGSGPGRRIPSGMVYGMNRMMEAVMAEGTGRNAAFGHPAGGKTGTTEEHRDAWFLGYTRDYVAGVWMGNDNGAPSRGVTGGGLPARLWRAVMAAGHEGLARRELPGERPGGFWSRIFGDLDIRPAGDDEDRRDRFRHRD
ncbi:MAG TPA: PBP1A family penicillin-binding protein [Alphaproteobacteria bacterium]